MCNAISNHVVKLYSRKYTRTCKESRRHSSSSAPSQDKTRGCAAARNFRKRDFGRRDNADSSLSFSLSSFAKTVSRAERNAQKAEIIAAKAHREAHRIVRKARASAAGRGRSKGIRSRRDRSANYGGRRAISAPAILIHRTRRQSATGPMKGQASLIEPG